MSHPSTEAASPLSPIAYLGSPLRRAILVKDVLTVVRAVALHGELPHAHRELLRASRFRRAYGKRHKGARVTNATHVSLGDVDHAR